MFGWGEKPKPAPAPEAPGQEAGEEKLRPEVLRRRLEALLAHATPQSSWPELQDMYRAAKDAQAQGTFSPAESPFLSPEEEAVLDKMAQAARENARATELGRGQ